MNQILSTKLKKNYSKKNWFKFQFWISIFIIVLIIFFGALYYYDLVKKQSLSNNLINNYSIYKLYTTTQNSKNESLKENSNGLFRNY